MGAFAPAIPFIIAGAQIVKGVGSVVNGYYQSRIAENNAAIEEQNARWAGQFGDINSTTASLKAREAIGAQTTRTAAAGVESTSGSAASVTEAQRALGQFNALTIRSNASREVYGLKAKAQGFRNKGATDVLGGWMDLAGSVGAAAGSFLGNAQSTPTPAASPYDFGKGMVGVSQ